MILVESFTSFQLGSGSWDDSNFCPPEPTKPPPFSLVFLHTVPEGDGSGLPAGDAFVAFPAAFAVAFQVHSAALRGTDISVRVNCFSALRAFILEQVRMFQEEGSEVEFVDVFPGVEAGIDFNGVLVKQ